MTVLVNYVLATFSKRPTDSLFFNAGAIKTVSKILIIPGYRDYRLLNLCVATVKKYVFCVPHNEITLSCKNM